MGTSTTARIRSLTSSRRAGAVVVAAFALLVSTWLSPLGVALGLDGNNDSVDFPDVDTGEVIEVTVPGTVLDGLVFGGSIIIKANNVTVQNSTISSSGPAPIRVAAGFTNILIRDSQLRCLDNNAGLFGMRAGIMGDDYTAVNVTVEDCAWAFVSGNGTTIVGTGRTGDSIVQAPPEIEQDPPEGGASVVAGEIRYSSSKDRSNPAALAAANVSASIAVFLAVEGDSTIDHVEWFLDGQPVRDDDMDPPYDLLPGARTSSGLLDTTGLIDGIHMVSAVAVSGDERTEFVSGFLVENTTAGEQDFELDPVPATTPGPVSALVEWSDIDQGRNRRPTITIDDSIYPDAKGVQFLVGGQIDERSKSARPNGYDATGPQDNSTFHVYPSINLTAGLELEARWVDSAGVSHADTIVVAAGSGPAVTTTGSPDVPANPVESSPGPSASDDGVNPPWDGTRGIYPNSPYPVPAGFPSPTTTGVKPGVSLTASGSLTITKPGTVIDSLDIDGNVLIMADNVTIRNSRITSSAAHPVKIGNDPSGRTFQNALIEDTRIRGVGDCEAAIAFSNYTARRVHITGCSDGAKAFSNTTIVDSYIAERYKTTDSHNDGIQSSGGRNIEIRHNTILGSYQRATSAIKVTAEQNDLSDVLIVGNYLSGGAYTVYTSQKSHQATNITVTGNTIEKDAWLYGDSRNTASGATYSANVIFDPTG